MSAPDLGRLNEWARRLRGDVGKLPDGALCVHAPGLGHSAGDRSLTVIPSDRDRDGFSLKSFADDDLGAAREEVKRRLGTAAPEPATRTNGHAKPRRKVVANYVYETETGALGFRKTRYEPKHFSVSRPTASGGWEPGGVADEDQLPFHLSRLLAVPPEEPVIVCEGEKAVLEAERHGLVATCASMGAGKWWASLNRHFAGKQVVIAPDHDEPGWRHALKVRANLAGVAASVKIVRLPDLGPGQDLFDYLKRGGDPAGIASLPDATPEPDAEIAPEPTVARTLSRPQPASVFAGRPYPQRLWAVEGLVPLGHPAGLDGDGGLGKGGLGLQLCCSTVLNRPWLGRQVMPGPSLFLTTEDDENELHRRLSDQAVHFGVGLEDLGDLDVWSLVNEPTPELAVAAARGGLEWTATWDALVARVAERRPVLVVLDARADLFGASEIDRVLVRSFVGGLRRLAQAQTCGVLLIGHPSQSGLQTGTGTSGSTGWNNSLRSRLYLERPPSADGGPPDPDTRLLIHKKNNYGPLAPPMTLRRGAGVFHLEGVAPSTPLERGAERRRVDALFLELLAAFGDEGRPVSANPGRSYAPTEFAADPRAGSVTKAGFRQSMSRLLAEKRIRQITEGAASRPRGRLISTGSEGAK